VIPVYVYPDPVASFATSGSCSNEPITFTSTSVVDSAAVTSWLWNYGDTNSDTGQTVVHLYGTASTWNITLIVGSNFGCNDTITQPLVVNPAPTAAFSVNPSTAANAYQTVSMTDQSSVAGNIIAWQWDFGDSTNSTAQNPSHQWAYPGLYPITLIVENNFGYCSV
jgi:PKD repeat protein